MALSAKICGITTAEALDAAIGGGARHVGFVFFAPSPRDIGFDQVRALADRVPDHVGRVGVFVNPDAALVERAVAAAGLDTLQLHKTAPDRAAALRQATARTVWAAVAVRTARDLEQAAAYRGIADRILYDAKTPEGAALPGGMGVRFDWALLDGFRHPLPWALSGGLDAGNVAAAARRTGATLVDVSSGVESAPGVKDTAKIAGFLRAVAAL